MVVGVSDYEDPEITDLSFAARDAAEVAGALREDCGFDEIRLLHSGGEREPTLGKVLDALRNLSPLITEDDLFLLYFAGHGIHMDGEGYLLTTDSRIRMPQLLSLQLKVLRGCLSRLDCTQRVLILDACRNDPHKGRGDADNRLSRDFSRDIVAMAGAHSLEVTPTTCILCSCSEGQRAYEWPDRQHGAFTYYLLDGLRGGAREADGALSVQGLSEYVAGRVFRWSQKMHVAPPQRPWAQQVGSLREVILIQSMPVSSIEPAEPQPKPRPLPLAKPREPEAETGSKEFVFVPEGSFLMGRKRKQHHTRSFWISVAPITCGEYARFLKATGYRPQGRVVALLSERPEDHPIGSVTLNDAAAYARWRGLRLPTEREWERAARGEDGRVFPWGDEFKTELCNCLESGIRKTLPARSSQSGRSPFGCYHMAGNVWEWTSSWYDAAQTEKVVRGGSYADDRKLCTCFYREGMNPRFSKPDLGFRCVKHEGGQERVKEDRSGAASGPGAGW